MANTLTAQRDELALGMGYFAALAVVVGPRVTENRTGSRRPTRSPARSRRPRWMLGRCRA
ncbi:hypothetical protein [Amycolatopsis sp. DG1A-15b]|uniref:hypothetical protein n=1 Tax=Amycolatopsis sp. DG1A-15b TaxID=3052846 RepID=UPI00255B833A|nr:hypothetical protein [Amycolatopsis sp. DG1A-15b]WIX87778.1 hypothetical protein QRY02_42685 [Amycolatopsis sp. DG1A-15b]